MNIDVLKTYKVVVERGSLTAASRELGLSQPAVSMQIASLEEYFGARLFYRTARGVNLTLAGKHVLELADKFEKSVIEARNSVAGIKDELEGVLRIAASNIPGMYVLPLLVSSFQQLNPKVRVVLEIQNTRKAVDKLLSGEADLAAIGEKIANDCIEYFPVKEDRIILIAPKNYDISGIRCLPDLVAQQLPMIRRTAGSATFRAVNCFLKQQGVKSAQLRVVSEYNSVIPQINSVIAGSGLAFVSRLAAKQAIGLDLIEVIDIKALPLLRTLYLVMKKTGDRSRIGSAFWQQALSGGDNSE